MMSHLKAWEANVKVHKRGLELIKPGMKCSDICHELNELFAELDICNIEHLDMDILLEFFHTFTEEKQVWSLEKILIQF